MAIKSGHPHIFKELHKDTKTTSKKQMFLVFIINIVKMSSSSDSDWLYMKLNMFKRGLVEARDIKDPLIYEVRNNGIVILYFSDEMDYFKLFGINEDNDDNGDWYVLRHVFSTYGDYEFIDYYTVRQDWGEGYIFRYFNDDNIERLTKLGNIFISGYDQNNDGDKAALADKLYEFFERKVDNILDSYYSESNRSFELSIRAEAINDMGNLFMSDGIYSSDNSIIHYYYTTVDNLIKLYNQYGNKHADLETLLTTIAKEKGEFGGYNEGMWEIRDDDKYFDDESFQKEVKDNLEDMEEALGDSDMFKDYEEYKRVAEKVYKKFTANTWYAQPKNINVSFRVLRIAPQTNKIELEVRGLMEDGKRVTKTGSLDLEGFNLFLYHPELF